MSAITNIRQRQIISFWGTLFVLTMLALVMTPVAWWVSRVPGAMPPHASFLPGFWLLVPGALGLGGASPAASTAFRLSAAGV